jgi:hypothetical protein
MKIYEIVQLTDEHMRSFSFKNNEARYESFYELDVIYFGFYRVNLYLLDTKMDLADILRGSTGTRTIFRDKLLNFLPMVYSFDWRSIGAGFQLMSKRKTFIKFLDRESLKEDYPEYFI